MTGSSAEDGLVVLSFADGGLDPFAVELADSGLDLCSLVLGSIPEEGLDPVLPPFAEEGLDCFASLSADEGLDCFVFISADEGLDCFVSSSADEGLVDSSSSFLVAALGSSATVSTDDGLDPFSAVIVSFLLVADLSFVPVGEFALDPFPPPFAELGLDPFPPPSNASDEAGSVFADSGRGSSLRFFAEFALDPLSLFPAAASSLFPELRLDPSLGFAEPGLDLFSSFSPVDDRATTLSADVALDPDPVFPDVGLDPFSPVIAVAAKASLLFADVGLDPSSLILAEFGLDTFSSFFAEIKNSSTPPFADNGLDSSSVSVLADVGLEPGLFSSKIGLVPPSVADVGLDNLFSPFPEFGLEISALSFAEAGPDAGESTLSTFSEPSPSDSDPWLPARRLSLAESTIPSVVDVCIDVEEGSKLSTQVWIKEDSKAPSRSSDNVSFTLFAGVSDFESSDALMADAYFSTSLLADVGLDTPPSFSFPLTPDDGRDKPSPFCFEDVGLDVSPFLRPDAGRDEPFACSFSLVGPEASPSFSF